VLKRLGVKYVAPVAPREVASRPETMEVPQAVSIAPRPQVLPVESKPPNESSSAAPVLKDGSVPGIVLTGPQADALTTLYRSIRDCQKCPLGKTRLNFVFGSGNPAAEVLFVGDAPGADEDERGLPFVDPAGQLLTKIIESTKTWKREDVFILNVLKCRPPGNRAPQSDEVEACRPHLEAQLGIIHPRLIVAMGTSAAQTLLKTKEAVGKLRGRWHDLGGIPLRVTYHPAALLHTGAYKKDVWKT
jgi:uracil-DNA glycosylase family 4